MDVEHDNDRTASLILQEIKNSDAGGEYSVSRLREMFSSPRIYRNK